MDPNNDVSLSTSKPARLPVLTDALKSPMLDEAGGFGPTARGDRELSLVEVEKGDRSRESLSRESIEQMIDNANIELKRRHTALSFRIDEATDSLIIQIIETASGDVIKQIPPEEILALKERLQEAIGVLLDTEV